MTTPIYPNWYHEVQRDALAGQINSDTKQRVILVDWIASIDARMATNLAELTVHLEALK